MYIYISPHKAQHRLFCLLLRRKNVEGSMWLWVTVLKEIALVQKQFISSHHCILFIFFTKKIKEENLPALYPSFSLTARFFSGRNNDECGFGSILLWNAKRKENFHNPQQLRVRDGPPGSSLSQSFATSPHLSQQSEEAGFRGVWGGCMTPHPGNSGRRSGHILFHWGGRGVQAVRSCEQRQRDTMQTQFSEWHVSKYTRRRRRGRSFSPRTFSRYCTSGPFWC